MDSNLKVAGIVKESIVDGPGIRLVVFAQGCKHHCEGCHNPGTHSFDEGKSVSIDDILGMVRKNPLLDGITFSGGEPFEQAETFAILAQKVKDLNLNVMTYTGYTYEQISSGSGSSKGWDKLLEKTDILVDGKFELSRKNLMLRFRGSENQRIIDVPESRKLKNVVLAPI